MGFFLFLGVKLEIFGYGGKTYCKLKTAFAVSKVLNFWTYVQIFYCLIFFLGPSVNGMLSLSFSPQMYLISNVIYLLFKKLLEINSIF